MIDNFTIVLPIRERIQYLDRFLNFHRDQRILAVDSSVENHADLANGTHVEYHWFGPYCHFKKIAAALERVTTKYVMVATDDDFFLERGIRDCVRILEAKPTAICVHGANVNFEEKPYPNINYRNHKTLLRNWNLRRRVPLATPFERFDSVFSLLSYSPYNATFRTEDLRKIIPLMLDCGFDKPGANDLGFAYVVSMFGDFLGSKELYCLKCIDAPSVRDTVKILMIDFWEQLLDTEPVWAAHYDAQRVRSEIPRWKARVTAQARRERMLGRLTDTLFSLGGSDLFAPYRTGRRVLEDFMRANGDGLTPLKAN